MYLARHWLLDPWLKYPARYCLLDPWLVFDIMLSYCTSHLSCMDVLDIIIALSSLCDRTRSMCRYKGQPTLLAAEPAQRSRWLPRPGHVVT